MDEFRILSIDEFDADFVQNKRVKKTVAEIPKQSLIPELVKNEPEVKPESTVAEDKPETTESTPLFIDFDSESEGEETEAKNEETLPAKDFIEEDDGEVQETSKPKKKTRGILAGKIISIVMLCVTVTIFFLGCFVSVFINNDGVDIGGVCLNSQVRDITIGNDTIKEGALIISKKIDAPEYSSNLNKPIAVPVENNSGCDIQYIYSVENISINESLITGYDTETNHISDIGISSVNCYGIVTHYLPAVGGIIVFAMNNAILVCALFVLLAAFWCLLLVLFEKNKKKNN